MSNYITNTTELTNIADAIRTKGGTEAQLTYPSGFVSAINNLPISSGSRLAIVRTSYNTTTSGQKYTVDLSSYGLTAADDFILFFAGNVTASSVRQWMCYVNNPSQDFAQYDATFNYQATALTDASPGSSSLYSVKFWDVERSGLLAAGKNPTYRPTITWNNSTLEFTAPEGSSYYLLANNVIIMYGINK